MNYKGFRSINTFHDGAWDTIILKNGELIKTISWKTSFDNDDIKKVIDEDIIPFI